MIIREYLIGRDVSTNKLKIVVGTNTMLYGERNSVPNSVSREHIKIIVADNGDIVLSNMNVENFTYVNNLCVEEKRIFEDDIIEIGTERYQLSWERVLDPILPKFADIRPLEKVWNQYMKETKKHKKENALINHLRYFSFALTSILGTIHFFLDNGAILSGIGAFISAVILLLTFIHSSFNDPLKIEKLQEEAENYYKCPLCGHPFPLQRYDLLRSYSNCPRCKAFLNS